MTFPCMSSVKIRTTSSLRHPYNLLPPAKKHLVAQPCARSCRYMAYMFKYDTVHGQFKVEIESDDGALYINGKKIVVNQSM